MNRIFASAVVPAAVFVSFACTGFSSAAQPEDVEIERAGDGGFRVKGAADILNGLNPAGLAHAADHSAVIRAAYGEEAAREFSAGKAISAAYMVTVARPDGNLLRYPAATQIVVFERGATMREKGYMTTFDGAILFSPMAEVEAGNAAATTTAPGRRLDDGVITLTPLASDDI